MPFPGGDGAGIELAKGGLTMIHCDELVLQLQARDDKKRHGVGHVNEKRVLEETSMIDTGELKSDSTVMEISMAGLRQGTLNQCASSSEKVRTISVSMYFFFRLTNS